MQRLSPGAGIALNLLYLNAKQWAFQYPAVREMKWMIAPHSAPPNFWSIQYDRRAWDARGRNFTLYKSDRTYVSSQKPSVHTELLHVDAGPKMSVAHKVYRSPMRYGAMRAESSSRPDLSKHSLHGTDEVVGPGVTLSVRSSMGSS